MVVRVRQLFDVKSFFSGHRRSDFSCGEVRASLHSGHFAFAAFIFASLLPLLYPHKTLTIYFSIFCQHLGDTSTHKA